MSKNENKYKFDKVKYPDGVGCCIWKPFNTKLDESDEDYSDAGICYDFSEEDIPEIISVLKTIFYFFG